MLKFKFLTGDMNWQEYGGQFVSKRLSNGEFDYWIVLDFVNMHEATGDEDMPKYHVSVLAVSPDEAGEDKLRHAMQSWSIEDQAPPCRQTRPAKTNSGTPCSHGA